MLSTQPSLVAGRTLCPSQPRSRAGDELDNNYSLTMRGLPGLLPGALAQIFHEYLTRVFFNLGSWSEIPKQSSFIKMVW